MDTQYIKVHQLKYEVFISFRGQDTRENLVSHIKRSLIKKGIKVFDDDDMGSGREITPTVLKAIRKSMVSVILFSKNFASSPWCLDELVNIMECKRTLKQKVIPVFYNVDPSDIEEFKGSFGEDLAKHESNYKYKEKVHVWRSALKEASSLSGLDSKNIRPDATLVQKIVRDILIILMNGQSPSYLQDDCGLPSMGMGYPPMYTPPMGAPGYFAPAPLMDRPLPFYGSTPPLYGSTPPLMFGIDDFHSPPPLMGSTPPPLMGSPFLPPPLPPPHSSFMFPYGPF